MITALLTQLSDLAQPSIFNTATPQADKIGRIGNGFLIAATAMFLLVVVLTIYIPSKYRSKPGDAEPRQTKSNRKLEITMVGIPLLMVIFFFFWSLNTMSAVLTPPESHKPDIIITGHQYWWQVEYLTNKFSTANEIHLPVGKTILLELKAADVIHDWWVPALGAKMDMIPGKSNYLWLTINKPGIYLGACSEFCGEQHAWMRIKVIAEQPGQYEQWIIGQQAISKLPIDTIATKGIALFLHASCSNCHSIRGTGANGTDGPDLTHFAARQTMLAGMLSNDKANVSKWLFDPQKVKPGAHMPRFIYGRDSLRALTIYLSSLK
jgi:cytochrome c oxidase subunit 2